MQTQTATQSTDYAQAITRLVANMPVERAVQVYDCVCFLRIQPVHPQLVDADDDDWLNDTEEQMRVEAASWDATYTRQRDKFAALVQTAHAEIKVGITQPLFDDSSYAVRDWASLMECFLDPSVSPPIMQLPQLRVETGPI